MYDCRFQCIRLVANSIVFMTVVTNVLASHFRGGIITWESNQNGEDPYLVNHFFALFMYYSAAPHVTGLCVVS
jgi:hypothetical protein